MIGGDTDHSAKGGDRVKLAVKATFVLAILAVIAIDGYWTLQRIS